jgi:hypothetical protein
MQPTRFRGRSVRAGNNVFDASRFGDLEVPTLYLHGGDSSEPFKAAGDALRGALPDRRVTAEVLSFLEAPGRAV